MGSDFVTVQTMASLSAPGSFSLIKRRGAQKLIQSHRSLFSRFCAWLLERVWLTNCATPQATQQSVLPMGIWKATRKTNHPYIKQ